MVRAIEQQLQKVLRLVTEAERRGNPRLLKEAERVVWALRCLREEVACKELLKMSSSRKRQV